MYKNRMHLIDTCMALSVWNTGNRLSFTISSIATDDLAAQRAKDVNSHDINLFLGQLQKMTILSSDFTMREKHVCAAKKLRRWP